MNIIEFDNRSEKSGVAACVHECRMNGKRAETENIFGALSRGALSHFAAALR
jgi:hypothetical protein